MPRLLKLSALLALLFTTGCFPIELDVNKEGKLLIPRQEGFFLYDPAGGKVQMIAGPANGEPVFGRFAPNGKDVLLVSKAPGGEFRFLVTPLAGGKGREVFKGENTGYVLYAPDGANLVIVRASDKEDPELKERTLETYLVPVDGGASKVIAHRTGVLCRWFADSKRLLIFELLKKDKSSHYFGNIAVLDVATGISTPLAAVAVQQEFFFDLSRDNKKVLFTALRAANVGTNLEQGNEFQMSLFELDVAEATIHKTNRRARYAIYSPDGKKVLLGSPPKGFSLDSLSLEIADAADLTKATEVAADAYMPFISFGGEGLPFPGWINDKTIFYFKEKHVYGTQGKSINLMIVGADGGNRKCVQPQIETEILKIAP